VLRFVEVHIVAGVGIASVVLVDSNRLAVEDLAGMTAEGIEDRLGSSLG